MSCSYGPGRYDPLYEEKGIDYPVAYVRWTEQRNMQAFQELIFTNKIDVNYLTTHIFKLEDAPEAYDLMLAKNEPFVGILIEYDVSRLINKVPVYLPASGKLKSPHTDKIGIGFIGAGSYAQSHLLPNIPKNNIVALRGVMTASGTGSRSVAERFGFDFCAGNEEDLLGNSDINTIFIATRHDSHADYVLKALKAGKNVFVEKPLCLTEAELWAITSHLETSIPNPPLLMVGYNRRFSPFARRIKDTLGSGTMAMTYRVNAGAIPKDSWIQDKDLGGSRIIGEVCHFVDFFTYINGSLPVSVHARALNDPDNFNDTLIVIVFKIMIFKNQIFNT